MEEGGSPWEVRERHRTSPEGPLTEPRAQHPQGVWLQGPDPSALLRRPRCTPPVGVRTRGDPRRPLRSGQVNFFPHLRLCQTRATRSRGPWPLSRCQGLCAEPTSCSEPGPG